MHIISQYNSEQGEWCFYDSGSEFIVEFIRTDGLRAVCEKYSSYLQAASFYNDCVDYFKGEDHEWADAG